MCSFDSSSDEFWSSTLVMLLFFLVKLLLAMGTIGCIYLRVAVGGEGAVEYREVGIARRCGIALSPLVEETAVRSVSKRGSAAPETSEELLFFVAVTRLCLFEPSLR